MKENFSESVPQHPGKMTAKKKNVIYIFSVLFVVVIVVSCQKNSSSPDMGTGNDRKIRFQLYTNQDFSDDNSIINFSIFIRDANVTLFDSALPPIKIKDIPDGAHKLIIEKNVPGNNNSDLAAGFHYAIENVGISSYIDTSKAGNTLKVIDYAFQ